MPRLMLDTMTPIVTIIQLDIMTQLDNPVLSLADTATSDSMTQLNFPRTTMTKTKRLVVDPMTTLDITWKSLAETMLASEALAHSLPPRFSSLESSSWVCAVNTQPVLLASSKCGDRVCAF